LPQRKQNSKKEGTIILPRRGTRVTKGEQRRSIKIPFGQFVTPSNLAIEIAKYVASFVDGEFGQISAHSFVECWLDLMTNSTKQQSLCG
jgi:hypothetical protein